MNKNQVRLHCVIILVWLLMTGCSNLAKDSDKSTSDCIQSARSLEAPMLSDELTQNQIFEELPLRKERFLNALKLQLVVNNVENVSIESANRLFTKFDLNVYITNISTTDLVVRTPQTMGFISDPNISGGAIYDLTLHLQTMDGTPIGAWNKFEFLDEDKVKLEDFLFLRENETSCIHVSLNMPLVFIQQNGYDVLPAGEYLLFASYENHMIGYSVPLLETPPADLTGAEEISWRFEHKKQVDLNAWVGKAISAEVAFAIRK